MVSQLGRYEIREELGRGSMGIIYKAMDPLMDRFVAVKVINLASLPGDEIEEYEARLIREAKLAGRLNHRNISTIHDMGKCGDVAYIAMEVIEGRELREVMERKPGLSLTEALDISIQVASGLGYAHERGVVHHDIKPANIMVLDDNQVKITDFGIARMTQSGVHTRGGTVLGSPSYMSPEQVQGHALDARTDIFSFGVVMYQMLTGRLPFTGDDAKSVMIGIAHDDPPPPSASNRKIPRMLDDIVAKCLAKRTSLRYQNANELADDLRSCRELLRGASATHHRLLSSKYFKRLRRLAVAGGLPEKVAVNGAYAMIAAIFCADVISDATVQMHLLYIFPLSMIAFHCGSLRRVYAALAFAIALQAATLYNYGEALPTASKVILSLLVLPSNLMIVYIGRIARANFLEVDHLVAFDWLTGLRNRQGFESVIEAEIKRQKRYGGVFSVACLDLDDFRSQNAFLGDEAGDDALKLCSQVIREHTRQSDTPARLRGDEFAILLPNMQKDQCAKLCEQLSALIRTGMSAASFPVSASIGGVTFEQPPASAAHALDLANQALSTAKACGKGGAARD